MLKTLHKTCYLMLSLLIVISLCTLSPINIDDTVTVNSDVATTTTSTDVDTTRMNSDIDAGLALNFIIANNAGRNSSKIQAIDNGSTLEEVANNIKNQSYESIAGFDSEGKKLFNYTCNLKGQVFTTNTQREDFANHNGTLVIHNHPSDSSFSAADLYAEAYWNTPCSMVVSERYVYILRPNSSGWGDPAALRDYHNERIKFYEELVDAALATTKFNPKHLIQAPMREDDGTFIWFCENELREQYLRNPHSYLYLNTGVWITNRTVEDLADEFDLFYQRIPFGGFDFTDLDFLKPIEEEITNDKQPDPAHNAEEPS